MEGQYRCGSRNSDADAGSSITKLRLEGVGYAMNRLPLGRAHTLASRFGQGLRQALPDIDNLAPVGGLRRFSAHVDRER